MPRRWVRYQLPVMVCVEISDTEEHEQVTKVVLGTEADDLQLARDLDGHQLVYAEPAPVFGHPPVVPASSPGGGSCKVAAVGAAALMSSRSRLSSTARVAGPPPL